MFEFTQVFKDLDKRGFPDVLERAKVILITLKGKPELLDKETIAISLEKCKELISEGSISAGVLAIYGYCLISLNRLSDAETLLMTAFKDDSCKMTASYFLELLKALKGNKETDGVIKLMNYAGGQLSPEDKTYKSKQLLKTMSCDLLILEHALQSDPAIIIVNENEQISFSIVEESKTPKARFNKHFQMLSTQKAGNDIDNNMIEELKIVSKELWNTDPQDIGAQAIYLWLRDLTDISGSFHKLNEQEVALIEAVGYIEKCTFATSRDEIIVLQQKALMIAARAKLISGATILHTRLAHTLGPGGLLPKGY